ncbi:MAG: rubredoxin-like domain-containing protein [Halobacteriales archaeon]
MRSDPDPTIVDIGEVVYDGEGNRIGTVRGFDEDGVFVTTREGVESLSVAHERAGPQFGEAELVWRCSECGAVDDLEGLPAECPDCGAPREHLYYWTED